MADLTVTMRSSLGEIVRLMAKVETFELHGIPDGARMHVTLALDELVTNAISYGFEDAGDTAEASMIRLR